MDQTGSMRTNGWGLGQGLRLLQHRLRPGPFVVVPTLPRPHCEQPASHALLCGANFRGPCGRPSPPTSHHAPLQVAASSRALC